MPLRFRRSRKIPQGIKVNFGKKSGTELFNADLEERVSQHKNVAMISWLFFLAGFALLVERILTEQALRFTVIAVPLFFGFLAFRPLYYLIRRRLLQKKSREICASAAAENRDAVEQLVGEALASLDWLRETTPNFELSPDGKAVYVDIDLPDVQIMYKRYKPREAIIAEYSAHVYGIVMRIAKVCFALFPAIETVLCSGYTQRNNPQTGAGPDDYVISVIFDRDRWEKSDPAGAAPEEFIMRFPCRLDIDEEGLLQIIAPLSADDCKTS